MTEDVCPSSNATECPYVNDFACDDGGAGAEYGVCSYGTDCTDCGPRTIEVRCYAVLFLAGPAQNCEPVPVWDLAN